MLTYRVSDNVALRTGTPAKSVEPVEYEKHVYQQGLKFERPPFTFQTDKWQGQAEERMSAESKGYVRIFVALSPDFLVEDVLMPMVEF